MGKFECGQCEVPKDDTKMTKVQGSAHGAYDRRKDTGVRNFTRCCLLGLRTAQGALRANER